MSVRSRSAQARGGREDERACARRYCRTKLADLRYGRLVHVPTRDELDTGGSKLAEDGATAPERTLARSPPRRCRQMMVESHHAQRARRRIAQVGGCSFEVGLSERPALLAPRANRAQADDDELVRGVNRVDRSEHTLPLGEGPREAGGDRVRDVVVTRDREKRDVNALEERTRPFELGAAPAVREVSRGEEERRLQPHCELPERGIRLVRLASADVQVGHVENARGHRRGRLYTRMVADESPELFDDIYLGLRAGGAVRKQRRGEPLSVEEDQGSEFVSITA